MLIYVAERDQRAAISSAREGVFEEQLASVVPVMPLPVVE